LFGSDVLLAVITGFNCCMDIIGFGFSRDFVIGGVSLLVSFANVFGLLVKVLEFLREIDIKFTDLPSKSRRTNPSGH
jgi:hypothetical protein